MKLPRYSHMTIHFRSGDIVQYQVLSFTIKVFAVVYLCRDAVTRSVAIDTISALEIEIPGGWHRAKAGS